MSVLREVLYVLPVLQWIMFKVAVAIFDCIGGTDPAALPCFEDTNIAGRAHLRSAERCDVLVPRTRTQLAGESRRLGSHCLQLTAYILR